MRWIVSESVYRTSIAQRKWNERAKQKLRQGRSVHRRSSSERHCEYRSCRRGDTPLLQLSVWTTIERVEPVHISGPRNVNYAEQKGTNRFVKVFYWISRSRQRFNSRIEEAACWATLQHHDVGLQTVPFSINHNLARFSHNPILSAPEQPVLTLGPRHLSPINNTTSLPSVSSPSSEQLYSLQSDMRSVKSTLSKASLLLLSSHTNYCYSTLQESRLQLPHRDDFTLQAPKQNPVCVIIGG